MDKALFDRESFIGGSEANMIYANYNTKTFIKWWEHKLTRFPKRNFTNKAMSVGTILESDIIDLYEHVNGVTGQRDLQSIKGIARASTDYILGEKVSDVKATTKAFEWFINERVPINYKRQLIHYMYVFELKEASIIAYQVNDELLSEPFQELDKNKLFEIPVKITKKDIETHHQKLSFLEHCRDLNIFPKA
jgi:predicted phage-related endonuclease